MVFLITMTLVAVAILGFRGYRLIQFYKESNNSQDEDERKVARKNYIIHLVFVLLILLIVIVLVYKLLSYR